MRFPLPPPVQKALDHLEAAGYAAYVVGGCVRDDVLGVQPHEYDLCSAARPEQVHAVFEGCRVINTGIHHGTVTVVLDGMPLEITTFRSDGTYSDNRRPDSVRFSQTIEEDLQRRDFTCNAMAFSPVRGFVDPYDGRTACAQRVLAAVGNPQERFSEDALRILRALRFAAVLGFAIEPDTLSAMQALRGNIARLSRERVATELNKLLPGAHAADVLQDNLPLMQAALPALSAANTEEDAALWAKAVRTLQHTPPRLALRWAALLHGYGSQAAQEAMRSLKQPNELSQQVLSLVSYQDARVLAPQLPRWLSRLGLPLLEEVLALQKAMCLAEGDAAAPCARFDELTSAARTVHATHPCLSLQALPVNGKDLMALGYPPGPHIGTALQWLLDQVLDGLAPAERDALLALAADRLQTQPPEADG